MKKRVGILGGSFDPVHNGHVGIARSFLLSGLIDELVVTLSPSPPHKKNEEQTAFSHRFKMLKLAFENMENVVVSDVEKQLSSPSYTLHTIEFLQSSNPDTIYYLCLGEDSLRDFHQWHKYREILKRTDLLVAERPGFDHSQISPAILEHVIFVNHKPYSASSTKIRQANGDKKNDLPENVTAYIEKNNLYR